MQLQLYTNTQPNIAYAPPAQGIEVVAEDGTEMFLRSDRSRLVVIGSNRFQIISGLATGKVVTLSAFQQEQLLKVEVYMPRDTLEFEDVVSNTGRFHLEDRLIHLPLEKAYLFTAGKKAGRKIEDKKAEKKLRISPFSS